MTIKRRIKIQKALLVLSVISILAVIATVGGRTDDRSIFIKIKER